MKTQFCEIKLETKEKKMLFLTASMISYRESTYINHKKKEMAQAIHIIQDKLKVPSSVSSSFREPPKPKSFPSSQKKKPPMRRIS